MIHKNCKQPLHAANLLSQISVSFTISNKSSYKILQIWNKACDIYLYCCMYVELTG